MTSYTKEKNKYVTGILSNNTGIWKRRYPTQRRKVVSGSWPCLKSKEQSIQIHTEGWKPPVEKKNGWIVNFHMFGHLEIKIDECLMGSA